MHQTKLHAAAGALALLVAGMAVPSAAAAAEPAIDERAERVQRALARLEPVAGGLKRAERSPLAAEARAALGGDATKAGGTFCAERVEADQAFDVPSLDLAGSGLFVDCSAGIWAAGLQTYDTWSTGQLDSALLLLDTDRSMATGCDGDDYIVGTLDGYTAGVFASPSCDGDLVFAGEAVVDRAGSSDFLALVWDARSIGSPVAVDYWGGLGSTSGVDTYPDSGGTLTLVAGAAGPPRPAAVARGVEDACPSGRVREDGFGDVAASNPHEAAVDCVVQWGVAGGKGPGRYAPAEDVSREQMASFIARFVERSGGSLPAASRDHFADDGNSAHQDNINRLAEAGIVGGTGGATYNPLATVSRAQMAAFLTRAYDYRAGQGGLGPLPAGGDYFGDDDQAALQADINKAAAAGFTGGGSDGRYHPTSGVKRDQMGSFLARVLDLVVENGMASAPQ